MTTTAKLFMSGRSQAIRLPAKLRLQAKEVRIEQIGNAFWLQPQIAVGHDLGQWLQDFLWREGSTFCNGFSFTIKIWCKAYQFLPR